MNKFFTALSLLFCFSSCVQDDYSSGNNDSDKSRITFQHCDSDVFTESRAASMTASTIKSYGVTCAYYPRQSSYADAACGSYFYNLKVDANDGATDYFWPGKDWRVSFYAYTPCDNANISLVTSPVENGIPKYHYSVPSNVDDQVDFLTCNILDHEGISFSPIPLRFKHRCCDVKFLVTNESISALTLTCIYVTGVKYAGNCHSDRWELDNFTNSKTVHPLLLKCSHKISSLGSIDATDKDKHFILLPQNVPKGTEIFTFLTLESGEEKSYSYVLPEDMAFKEGHSYTFRISLASSKIVVEDVSIEQWLMPETNKSNATINDWTPE